MRLRHWLHRAAMWLGYRCLAVACWTIRPEVEALTSQRRTGALPTVEPVSRVPLTHDVIAALIYAHDARLRRGEERVH